MLAREFMILAIFAAAFVYSREKEEKLESYCNINGKKVLHRVSDKFLSISIDPAVLLAGLNLSDTSLRLAKQLSPAYIRIAGPSTKFVKYVDNEYKSRDRLSEDGNNVVVTPSMWFGINEWFNLANLTPVFGINDVDTDREGDWNPKSTLPLLEISDKLNVTCYWQLGFDSSEKSVAQYKQDLNLLHLILAEFPGRNESWKIVGSDISNIPSEYAENVLGDIKDIATAVMWEPSRVSEESFPEKNWSWKILQQQQYKPQVKIWTTVPKSSDPISFSSAMLWASQIGNAAKFGYEVVFRQPDLHEMFSDTPVYWFSLLYKKLMGNNVLDAKTTAFHPGCLVYAHCTAKENHFLKQGAVTLMIINKNSQSYKVKVKLGRKPMEKTMELQSYILTAPSENSTEIYLNGNKLTSGLLGEANYFEPKVREVKSKPHMSLELPPLSIGFFVLPNTRLPVCLNSEKEMIVPFEQLIQDQSNSHSQESSEGFGKNLKSGHTTDNKNKVLSQEVSPNINPTFKTSLDFLKQALQYVSMYDSIEDKVNQRGRKFFSARTKVNEQEKMQSDPKSKIEGLSISPLQNNNGVDTGTDPKLINLNLTSEEVEKILRDRARAKEAMKHAIVVGEEIGIPIEFANTMFVDSKLKGTMPEENLRLKRDINMQLLERQGIFGSTSAKYSNDDYYDHKSINDQLSKNNHKRIVRQVRDINMKLLDFKSKLEDNRQRMEDKKYSIVGNAQSRRKNIKDKISKLRNKNRFKRDINMDLLKIKSEVQKKKSQKEERKSLFKDREEKTATIRKPGQTSEELLAELEEEEEPSIEEKKVQPKVDVYAELALPEDEEDMDYMNENIKPKRPNIFDKKTRGKSFGTISKLEGRSNSKSKKNKEEEVSEDIQFLTTSEEFTDIEEDYPCIHEYFGPQSKKNYNRKQIMRELGENEFSVRKPKNGRTTKRKMTELEDMMNSEESEISGYLRKRRNVEQSEAEYNKNYIIELGEVDYFNRPIKKQKSESQAGIDDKLPVELDAYMDETYLTSPRDLEMHNSYEDTTEQIKRELEESSETDEDVKSFDLYHKQQQLLTTKTTKNSEITSKSVDDDESVLSNRGDDVAVEYREDSESESAENKMIKNIDNEDHLRSKRDLNRQTQEDNNGKLLDIKNYLKDFEKETKHNLEEFASILTKDSHRVDLANTPMQFKDKPVEDLLEKATNNGLGSIQKIEKENLAEMPDELALFKEYLTHSKNEIEKLLLKEFELYKEIEERQQNMIKDILQQEHKNSQVITDTFEKVSKPEREILDINVENANLKIKNQLAEIEKSVKDMMISENNKFQFLPTAQLAKRSIFDNTCNIFGNYKPLTADLKPWKPSDILSLKRDVSFLTTPKLKPITDPQIFKNVFDRSSNFNMRRRRSVDDNHLDNDIDVFMNEIEQDNRYKRPKLNMEVDDYMLASKKLMLSNKNDNKMSSEDVKRNKTNTEKIEKLQPLLSTAKDNNEGTHKKVDTDLKIKNDTQVKTQGNQEETTTIDPIIYYTFNDDFEKEIESDVDATTESMKIASAAVSPNVEQLPSKQEETIFQNLLNNVTGFFANIGRKIGHYMKEIGLN